MHLPGFSCLVTNTHKSARRLWIYVFIYLFIAICEGFTSSFCRPSFLAAHEIQAYSSNAADAEDLMCCDNSPPGCWITLVLQLLATDMFVHYICFLVITKTSLLWFFPSYLWEYFPISSLPTPVFIPVCVCGNTSSFLTTCIKYFWTSLVSASISGATCHTSSVDLPCGCFLLFTGAGILQHLPSLWRNKW